MKKTSLIFKNIKLTSSNSRREINNYKGFTLIELLAVIVILAIIALIAVPFIMNIIDKAKKSAFEDSAYGILKASELYYADNLLNDNNQASDLSFYGPSFDGLEVKGDKPSSGVVSVKESGQIALILTSDKWIAYKKLGDRNISMEAKTDEKVEEIEAMVGLSVSNLYKDASGANIPILKDGMIPIYFEGNTAKKADIKGKWYDYNNREWANAVLVTNATRDTYKNAAK
ncbi:MAG: prepilin-type N-terminal cleavage/methylation domain-containing protein, partial [Bacilli bacterium]